MRIAGPRRVPLGRDGRWALSFRWPQFHEIQPRAGPAPDAHLPALRNRRRPSLRGHGRGTCPAPGPPVRRRRRQDGARCVRRQPPGRGVGLGRDRLCRHRPRTLLGQERPLRGGQGGECRRRRCRRRSPRGRRGHAVLRARRPSLPEAVGAGRRVRTAARPSLRGDDRRRAVRPGGASVGPHRQAPVCPAQGRPEVRARRRGPARVERGRPTRLRRPGRSAGADRPGPRFQAGRRLAPRRATGGPRLRRRALRARRQGGLALGRIARGRARPPARARRIHQLDPLRRPLPGSGLGRRPSEGDARPRRDLGWDRAGPEPAGSHFGRRAPARSRGRPRRQHDRDARGGKRRQRVDRLLARGRHAHDAGREAATLCGRRHPARTVPGGRDPRPRRRRGLVRGRRGALPAARGLERHCARTGCARPREAGQRPRVCRGPRRHLVRREQTGDSSPDGLRAAQVHARGRPARGLPLFDRVRRRWERRRGVPGVDRRRESDHRGRPDQRQTDQHRKRVDLEQGGSARPRFLRRVLDRNGDRR